MINLRHIFEFDFVCDWLRNRASRLRLYCMSDEKYLKWLYYNILGEKLDLDNPQTYNEKVNWLKLHDRNPFYHSLVDKYEVKKYVATRIGAEHVIPCYGVWNRFDEIDFTKLPEQFVLKCTHDSGSVCVCLDKKTFDFKRAKNRLEESLSREYYTKWREWAYKGIKGRIIAEKYIDSLGKPDSLEYKITCMNGRARMITVCTGLAHDDPSKRFNDHYDRDFNILPFSVVYKPCLPPRPLPKEINELIKYSEMLSESIPQVRVDFYIVDGTVYFGEMTFYTWAALGKFEPKEYGKLLGDWIDLSCVKKY